MNITIKAVTLFLLILPKAIFGQTEILLPFYYEKNLPTTGNPHVVEEYYYEYHSQEKAHYYRHIIEYDSLGRVKKHVKSNVGLLDSISLTFQNIIDPRAVTINYLFEYDSENRLVYFIKNQYQEEVGEFRQDEEWKFDIYSSLIEHNFWEVKDGIKTIKNLSTRLNINRNQIGEVKQVDKFTYSFAAKDLVLSEITRYGYKNQMIDTISVFQISNGNTKLKETKYDLSFKKYSNLNPDSIVLKSYYLIDNQGDTTFNHITYDERNRKVTSNILKPNGDTVTFTKWEYFPFSSIENTDNFYRLEVYWDETRYERYREEFENGYSLAVPADLNSRVLEQGKMKNALLEIWDPVTRFYRKDTEYIYFDDLPTGLLDQDLGSKLISLYPNPNVGVVYINNAVEIEELTMLAADGRYWKLKPSSSLELDQPKGFYIFLIKLKDGSVQKTKITLQ